MGVMFGELLAWMLVLMCLVAAIGVILVVLVRYATQPVRDLAWYRRAFPYCVPDGRLLCCRCGSERIGCEQASAHIRRHVCEDCGAELFESAVILMARNVAPTESRGSLAPAAD
jgi:hypothetical protein